MSLTRTAEERMRLVAEINALRLAINQYGDAPTWTRSRLRRYVNVRWDAANGLADLNLSQLGELHAALCDKLRARRELREAERGLRRPLRLLAA